MERQPGSPHLNNETLERLSAFYLYKSHGLETALNVYPGQRSFILANKDRTLKEVRRDAYRDSDKNSNTHLL